MSQHITASINSGDIRQFTNSVAQLGSRIDDVGDKLNTVNRNLNVLQAEFLAQIGITIERLNRQIEKTEEVRSEVERNTEASAQSLLIQTAGKIFGQVGLISSQRKRLRDQFEKSIIRINRINEKYTKLNFNVEQSYHKDVVRLGKFIFEIWDLYTKAVEERLLTRHSSCFESIQRVNEEIRNLRETLIRQNYNNAKQKVETFFQDRQVFKESIEKLVQSDIKESQSYAIPVLVSVESSEKKDVNVVIGEEIRLDNSQINPIILDKTDWFHQVREIRADWENSIEWRELNESELEDYVSLVGNFEEKGYFSKEFSETFCLALNNSPPKISGSPKSIQLDKNETINIDQDNEDDNNLIEPIVLEKINLKIYDSGQGFLLQISPEIWEYQENDTSQFQLMEKSRDHQNITLINTFTEEWFAMPINTKGKLLVFRDQVWQEFGELS
jgi:hypothetical protein